jgi:hypothetical protein
LSQNEYFWYITYVWNRLEALLEYDFGQIWHEDFEFELQNAPFKRQTGKNSTRFARWWKWLNNRDAAGIVRDLRIHKLMYIRVHVYMLIFRTIRYGYGWETVYV